jgi:hypothetical protein
MAVGGVINIPPNVPPELAPHPRAVRHVTSSSTWRRHAKSMNYEWGRAAEAGKWQRAVPVWFMSVILRALASGIGVR